MCLYHCISEGTLSLENVQWHFNFILHVMSDKAAFVSSAYSPTSVSGETSKFVEIVNWWVFVKCEPKSSQLKEPKT